MDNVTGTTTPKNVDNFFLLSGSKNIDIKYTCTCNCIKTFTCILITRGMKTAYYSAHLQYMYVLQVKMKFRLKSNSFVS